MNRPQFIPLSWNGGVNAGRGDQAQPRPLADAEIHFDLGRVQAANELGLIAVRQRTLERAVDYFAMALKAAPSNHLIAFNLGAAYHDLGRFDKATEF